MKDNIKTLELYIHFPFCVSKCNYCDFLSFPAVEELKEKYCHALMREVRQTAQAVSVDHPDIIQSIFVGGGTPSFIAAKQMEKLFVCLKENFHIQRDAEISIETNPGTIDETKLFIYREAGINRLSIGLQSTEDSLLRTLGRVHTFRDFEKNYYLARKAGFNNINIDIMSALPGQTPDAYKETLRIVTDYRPEHISAYSLIIEEGTPFARDAQVLSALPDEETERKMYELTKEILLTHGYGRYEISNYALPGRECRHNTGYWKGTPYLGLGLGASSYYDHARFSNETDIYKYIENPFIPFADRAGYEKQTVRQEMEDTMIFGLRMMEGVSKEEFAKAFGKEMDAVYGDVIKKYSGYGMLKDHNGRVFLTDAGIDVSNRIFEDFLLG